MSAYLASAAAETKTEVMASVLASTLVQPSWCARERSPRDTASATFALDSTLANCGLQARRAAVPQKVASMPLTKASLGSLS